MGFDVFTRIGDAVEARWRAVGYREEALPAIAAAVLRELDAPSHATPADITRWVMESASLPPQVPLEIEFPFTIYRAERFTVQAFFWVDGTTDIHDHSLWGAFQVFEGSSIQCRYEYRTEERASAYAERGDLEPLEIEQLQKGDVCEIHAGRAFIHSLFHLDRPSVTILVSSSRRFPEYAWGRTYMRPGFVIDRGYESERLDRQMRVLDLVQATAPDDYPAAVTRFVSDADVVHGFFALLRASLKLDAREHARILEEVRPAHAFAPLWIPVFEEIHRQAEIVMRRSVVRDVDHRFFLALVLNVPSRDDIFAFVRRRAPGREPIDTILTWVKELADVPVDGPSGPTAIGVPLDESGLIVLRSLMLGRDTGGVLEALKAEFDAADVDAQAEAIVDMVAAFRESLFFRSLLPR